MIANKISRSIQSSTWNERVSLCHHIPGTMEKSQLYCVVVAMGYFCDLGAGQRLYLENLHDQTLVTVVSSSPGQQQQSSSGFQTGHWTAQPNVFRGTIGVVVKLYTVQGERFVLLQGTSLSVLNEAPSFVESQRLHVQSATQMPVSSMPPFSAMPPLSPMPPIPSMSPMKMGNLQMDQDTMSMQMGNMRMSMAPIAQSSSQSSAAASSETATGQRRFCSQCGTAIKLSDRFCAHCGHQLD